jgi:Spy/CpxP family protein refolding chaperone
MSKKQIFSWIGALVLMSSISLSALSQQSTEQDPFNGRLFAPNIVLENQNDLELTDSQLQQIRELVISTQTTVTEHQWDMREAYREVMTELDQTTIDEAAVAERIQLVLETENKVKLAQMSMLIRLRNLLTEEQVALLRERASGME